MRLLVDGHNLIGKIADIELSDEQDEAKLTSRLRRYAARSGNNIIVIFDGGLPGGTSRELSGAGVKVIFSQEGRTADSLIIKRINKIRDRSAWSVVSSDREILAVAVRKGIKVKSPQAMATELDDLLPDDDQPDPKQIAPSPQDVDAWMAEFSSARRKR